MKFVKRGRDGQVKWTSISLRTLTRQPSKEPAPAPYWRPSKRSECVNGPRPCPFVGCRHHLFLDVTARKGLRLWGDGTVDDLWKMETTCSLDVAEHQGVSFRWIARVLRVHFERVRQNFEEALYSMQKNPIVSEGADVTEPLHKARRRALDRGSEPARPRPEMRG